uniref:UBC core domain-containing protein n=1 Tax=Oryza brachyantha TaxID=4533 RepID=J3M317_ORYBR
MNFEIIVRPDEGYYLGGTFVFTFQVSPSYPHEPPKVKCNTKVYHPNIDLEGNNCRSTARFMFRCNNFQTLSQYYTINIPVTLQITITEMYYNLLNDYMLKEECLLIASIFDFGTHTCPFRSSCFYKASLDCTSLGHLKGSCFFDSRKSAFICQWDLSGSELPFTIFVYLIYDQQQSNAIFSLSHRSGIT